MADDERQSMEEIESSYGIKLIVKENPACHQENYEINVL
jgi:hypothetical protein